MFRCYPNCFPEECLVDYCGPHLPSLALRCLRGNSRVRVAEPVFATAGGRKSRACRVRGIVLHMHRAPLHRTPCPFGTSESLAGTTVALVNTSRVSGNTPLAASS